MPRQGCRFEGCVREATRTDAHDVTHGLALCTPHRTAVRHALRTGPDHVQTDRDADDDARPQRAVTGAPEA
jgi:hypothetical protein